MKIAIPRLGEEIAPWFDVATHIGLYSYAKEGFALSDVLVFPAAAETTPQESDPGVARLRRILEVGVNIIICGGISNKYKHMAQSRGITIINHVTGTVESALQAFTQGELCGANSEPIYQMLSRNPPLADLIVRTEELFTQLGYSVQGGEEHAPFPIDLIAEIQCPICSKLIRIAICCGMHAYRADEEISEFHQAAAGFYDAELYVNARSSEVDKVCLEFGIQILDPAQFEQLLTSPEAADRLFPGRSLGMPLVEHLSCQV